MAKGVSVSVAADTKAFQSGIRSGIIEPLQSTDQALQKITAAGDKAGTELEHTFSEQQRSTQQLRGEIDTLNRSIVEGSGSANRSMRQNSQQTVREVSEGYAEMKDSGKQNAIQTAASFNGTFDSLSGGVQGLVSEFAAGFGPAGLVAGIVGAGGLGMLTSAIDNATQATQADKQAVADLAKQYIDAGTKGRRAFSDVSTAIEDMATNTDGSAIITLQQAWKDSSTAGADYQSIVESIAEASPAQIQKALDKVVALRAGYTDLIKGSRDYEADPNASLKPKINAVGSLADALKKAKKEAEDAARAQDLAAAAGMSKFQLKVNAVKQLHDAYASAAGETTKYENKEQTLLDVTKYIKAMEKREKALRDYQKTLSTSTLSAGAKAYIESLGESDAAAYLAGYAKATPKQRAQLDSIWTTAGKTNAQTYGDALGEHIKGIKPAAPHIAKPIVPAPDTSRLDAFLRTPRVARIVLDVTTRNGQRVL